MKSIDLQGDLGEYVLDDKRKISKDHLNSVCKIYQKEKSCRYISLSTKGFVCMKKTPIKNTLDKMALGNKMVALGDNCEGIGEN